MDLSCFRPSDTALYWEYQDKHRTQPQIRREPDLIFSGGSQKRKSKKTQIFYLTEQRSDSFYGFQAPVLYNERHVWTCRLLCVSVLYLTGDYRSFHVITFADVGLGLCAEGLGCV